MCKLKTLVIILFSVSLVSISNAASIIYVDVNGPNDPGTGTFDDPFRKIQDAIDDANDGDTIEIRPGLYSGDRNYDLDPNGLAITIRSTDPNDPNIIADTIIDPNRAGRGFYFHSGEDANCIVSGLTIKSGYAPGNGGAIYCKGSSPTIYKCVVRESSAGSYGGGIYCDSSLTISDCVINENSASLYGGGIYCESNSPQIQGCTITGNSAQEGGGVGCRWYASPKFTNCIISDNEASDNYGGGGGLDCVVCDNITLTNCTLARNRSAGLGGAVHCDESEVIIKNCILWANTAPEGPQIALESFIDPGTALVSYGDIQGGEEAVYVDSGSVLSWGSGNLDTDPCFASFEPNTEPNTWDFHLQSAYGRWDSNGQNWVSDPNTSLCIDAGDSNSDWSGEPWPNGKRINMGAYGGTNQASKNGNIADFNINGNVDFRDFAEFSHKWFAEEFCIEDLTNNGVVDFADLAIFVKNWLWQKE